MGLIAGRGVGEEEPAATHSGRETSETMENRVSGVAGPGPEDFQRRLERARELMMQEKLDALFVETGTTQAYFTGVEWWPSERVFGVVIPRRGAPAYVAPAFEEGRARESIAVGEELRCWQEDESPYRLIGGILEDRGIRAGRLGVDPDLRYFVLRGLQEGTAAEVVDGAAVVHGCRGHKNAREIGWMRLANSITQAAIARAMAGLRPGMVQEEAAAAVREAHQAQGAPPGWALVLFGPNAAFPHGTEANYQLQEGDVVLMDCGTAVHGYGSDITRTAVFGRPPSDRQQRIGELVRKAQEAARRSARPGVACGTVDAAARRVIEEGGFGPGYRYFTHRLGHGIGMDGHEWPYLVRGSSIPLEPGMTFSDEPGIYVVGELGVRLEDIIHITPEGCEYLSEPVESLPVVVPG
jgi:Xaa-Pro dipeptidase